jgi:hypothetical protein
LVERNKSEIVALVKSEVDYYSQIASKGAPVQSLVKFLSIYADIFPELSEAAKVIIKHAVDNDVVARCLGWFTKPSLEEHANDLMKWIEDEKAPEIPIEEIQGIRSLSDSPEWEILRRKVLNSYYGKSNSFDDADAHFDVAIKPYIEEYEKEGLEDLMEKINGNPQTFCRWRAKYDHSLIKQICDQVLGEDFDYSPFPNFISSLTRP